MSVSGGATKHIQGKEHYSRNFRSQLRTAMFHVYGGQDWANLLLALGGDGINADLIKCYNDEIDRRTPGGAHGKEAYVGPRLSQRGLAAAQGQPLPPVRGVQHKVSDGKVARKQARLADKHLANHPEMREDLKAVLQRDADWQWDTATRLSDGHAYYDREGVRVNAEDDMKSMVTDVIRAYADLRRLEYALNA